MNYSENDKSLSILGGYVKFLFFKSEFMRCAFSKKAFNAVQAQMGFCQIKQILKCRTSFKFKRLKLEMNWNLGPIMPSEIGKNVFA